MTDKELNLVQLKELKLQLGEEERFIGARICQNAIDYISNLVEAPVSPILSEQEYEPYFGWCDVDGCTNEGASGGFYWRETGYWTICSKHGDMARAKEPQPKMKQTAIYREKTRDKETGFLPNES